MKVARLSVDAIRHQATEAADFLHLFSTPNRLMLLCYIAKKERSVGEIQEELGLKQPGLSQQLAELRQAGVVQTRRNGRKIYYSVTDRRVDALMQFLMAEFYGRTPVRDEPPATSRPVAAHAQNAPTTVLFGEMARLARMDE